MSLSPYNLRRGAPLLGAALLLAGPSWAVASELTQQGQRINLTSASPAAAPQPAGNPDDCNSNGVPDAKEIRRHELNDCNTNHSPDICERDCDTNGTQDACDIAGNSAEDCNTNGVPDPCDVTGGTSSDFNRNWTPDECEQWQPESESLRLDAESPFNSRSGGVVPVGPIYDASGIEIYAGQPSIHGGGGGGYSGLSGHFGGSGVSTPENSLFGLPPRTVFDAPMLPPLSESTKPETATDPPTHTPPFTTPSPPLPPGEDRRSVPPPGTPPPPEPPREEEKPPQTPEPGTLFLLGLGVAGLAGRRRRAR